MRKPVLLSLILIFCVSCQVWEYPQKFPVVLTENVTNISTEGAEFIGIVENLNSDQGIINYGFVWGESEMPTLNSSRTFISDNIRKGRFSKIVNNDLVEGSVYTVRAFIQSDDLVIYGNPVTFTSQGSVAPAIIDFTPTEGFDGTEVTIKGQNFSSRIDGNTVKIGSLNCQVTSASDTVLTIQTPKTTLVGDYKISISVAGKTIESTDDYSILGPRIRTLSKLSGRVGDLLTVNGEYFDIGNHMSLYFGAPQQWITNYSHPHVLSSNQMECYVPDYANNNEKIKLYSYPDAGEKIFIFPEEFTIVNSWHKISESTPLENRYGYSSVLLGNSVFVIGGRELYQFNTTSRTWTKKQDFPGEYRYFGTSFSHNGKIYYGFGGEWSGDDCCESGKYFNDLWQYDPITDTWSYFLTAPPEPRARTVQFVIGDTVYMGFGWNSSPAPLAFDDFWSYSMVSNTWNQIEVPVTINPNSVIEAKSFSLGGKGYILGLEFSGVSWDRRADTWEFDPSIPAWTKKSDYPDMLIAGATTLRSNSALVLTSAANDVRSRIYEYYPEKDLWVKRQTLYGTTGPIQFSHYTNGKLYNSAGNFWELSFD